MSTTAPLSGYKMQSGRWARLATILLSPAAAVTANGSSPVVEIGDKGTVRLDLGITARSGSSPTLDVTVETSADGSTWRTLGTFAQKNATGTERKSFGGADRFVRASWVIGGTGSPSFTFTLGGEGAGG